MNTDDSIFEKTRVVKSTQHQPGGFQALPGSLPDSVGSILKIVMFRCSLDPSSHFLLRPPFCLKASNKLEIIESRVMRNNLRLHEYVRMWCGDLSTFMPEGDPNWLHRRFSDWMVL